MSEKITVKLSKPFEDGQGKMVDELQIREPSFRDLRLHGLPVSTDGTVDFEKASKLLESLTGVQRPYLDGLNVKDSMAAVKAMVAAFKLTEEDAKKLADELVFGAEFSALDVDQMTIDELKYWYERGSAYHKKLKDKQPSGR